MTTFLSKEIQDGLAKARKKAQRKSHRLRVIAGERSIRILRLEDQGFSVASEDEPPLRGLVDIYDGGRHLWQCLIVAASQEGEETRYEFKRQTTTQGAPAPDFVRAKDAPAGLLPRI